MNTEKEWSSSTPIQICWSVERQEVTIPTSAFAEFNGQPLLDRFAPVSVTVTATEVKTIFCDAAVEREFSRLFINRYYAKQAYARRKSAIAEAGGSYTAADLIKLWNIQGGRCYYTGASLGAEFSAKWFQVDHVTPLANGGSNGPANLVLVARGINQRKGVLTKTQFMAKNKSEITADRVAQIKILDNLRRKEFCRKK